MAGHQGTMKVKWHHRGHLGYHQGSMGTTGSTPRAIGLKADYGGVSLGHCWGTPKVRHHWGHCEGQSTTRVVRGTDSQKVLLGVCQGAP